MNETQRRRVADAPVSCRGIIARAYKGTASPRSAIKAFCLQCVGYVRKDVRDCTADGCPLFAYRPYQLPGELEAEEAAQEVRQVAEAEE